MAAQARQRAKGQRGAGTKPGMQIDWNGRTYIIREADLSPRDVAAIRKETGFAGWGGLASAGYDLDVLAALIWLARRLKGDFVPYESVLDEMSYEDDVRISVEGSEDAKPAQADLEDVTSPEA